MLKVGDEKSKKSKLFYDMPPCEYHWSPRSEVSTDAPASST